MSNPLVYVATLPFPPQPFYLEKQRLDDEKAEIASCLQAQFCQDSHTVPVSYPQPCETLIHRLPNHPAVTPIFKVAAVQLVC